jgi:hypothetical protein
VSRVFDFLRHATSEERGTSDDDLVDGDSMMSDLITGTVGMGERQVFRACGD